MRSLATWCVRHRRLVLVGWLVALVGLTFVSSSVGTAYKDSFSLNGTQSFEAQSLLTRVAPKAAGDREQIVIATGAWTPQLNRLLRRPIPIQPGKGYSVTMRRPDPCPLRRQRDGDRSRLDNAQNHSEIPCPLRDLPAA